MTTEWDAGLIVEQHSFPIQEDDTGHDRSLRLAETGSELACDLVESYPTTLETRPNETTADE